MRMLRWTAVIGEIIKSRFLVWTVSQVEEWRDQIVYLPSAKILRQVLRAETPDPGTLV